jgi:hypothetical protein
MRENCKLCKNGKCQKWVRERKCETLTTSYFDERFKVCEMEKVCEEASIYGNTFFFLTDEDIEKLKSGKVLFDIDEYGVFIAYKEG